METVKLKNWKFVRIVTRDLCEEIFGKQQWRMQHVLDVMTYYVEEQIQELQFMNSMDIKTMMKLLKWVENGHK